MCEGTMSSKIPLKPRQNNFFSFCEACKLCCCNGARPPLTLKRMKTIQNFLRANGISLTTPFENKQYAFPKETQDGYCIFFDKATSKCRIHPVKPETCVAGPVTFDINRQSGKIEWFLKTERICSLAGALYQDKKAFEEHAKSAKREILKLVNDLDSKALDAILTIEEPDTFKFGEDALNSRATAKLRQ